MFRMLDLEIREKIGEGFFGLVFLANHRRTGRQLVVKEMRTSNPETVQSFYAEIRVLKSLNHPNILRFIGLYMGTDDRVNLVTEYVAGGSLETLIHKLENPVPWSLR